MLSKYEHAQRAWGEAVQAHTLAPPDSGFARRLAALAKASADTARVCRELDEAGYDWTPHPAAREPPYELRPGTGRRGPDDLWRRFDQTVALLAQVSMGENMAEVAHAYQDVSAIATELVSAILLEEQDGEERPASRTRRSA